MKYYLTCDTCPNEIPIDNGIIETAEKHGWIVWVKSIGVGAICKDCLEENSRMSRGLVRI